MSESEMIEQGPCSKCGSSDANTLYDDGHSYCFKCRTHVQNAEAANPKPSRRRVKALANIESYTALPLRKLSEETCKKFGYGVGRDKGKAVQIAPYYSKDGTTIVAQKCRTKDKDFWVNGDLKEAGLFGQRLWRDSGKYLVITEGEIDAMSVSQAQDNKWPVVSVPNGASGAKKAIEANIDWVEKFEKVVIMFDMDEPGQKAAQEVAATLAPGKAYIATLPLKDANEMLVAGKTAALRNAIFEARQWRPDGLLDATSLYDEAKAPIEWGIDWPWPTLTKATYGRRRGEVYTLGAGTGVGKTDFFTQTIAFTLFEQKLPVAVFALEQPPLETVRRIAGKNAGLRLHVPEDGYTQEQLDEAIAAMPGPDQLLLYNHFGGTDWEVIRPLVRYAAKNYGCKDIFIDHLTALAGEDESESLRSLMEDIASLAQELKVTIYLISHLTTPEGKPHEEGGRVTIRHFRGSRAIGYWSHFMFGMERNQQASDVNARHTTTLRVLKDRYTGQATGLTIPLVYDSKTGLIHEKSEEWKHESDVGEDFDGGEDFESEHEPEQAPF